MVIVRLHEMKRILTALTLIAAVAGTQSGCMCVRAVKTGGTHYRRLQPTAVWTNSAAETMVECQLLDTQMLSGRSQQLGTRLVCASPSTWNSAIRAEVENQKQRAMRYQSTNEITHFFFRPTVTLSTTNATAVFTGEFVLYPPVLDHVVENDFVTSGWFRCGIPRNSSHPSWPVTLDGRTITVYVDSVALPQEVQRYKDWWWYPNQILLIPAYVVDIVTSPIQFLMVMNSLSKIDG